MGLVQRVTDWPLYALLRHMRVHVTAASSVVLEAARFGVPSVIYHLDGTDLFPAELARGQARFAADVAALRSASAALLAAPPAPAMAPVGGIDALLGLCAAMSTQRGEMVAS